MAPGTNIGAAHPGPSVRRRHHGLRRQRKGDNDAAAFIKSISEKRKRNVHWAEDAVRKSISIPETEALRDSVIDLIAGSIPALPGILSNGRTVEVEGGTKVLNTKNANVVEKEMGFKHKLLDVLSDPNIAYIFLLLGSRPAVRALQPRSAILPASGGHLPHPSHSTRSTRSGELCRRRTDRIRDNCCLYWR